MTPRQTKQSLASPYRTGQFKFEYRSRFFITPPTKPPALPESTPTDIAAVTCELVTAAAGVIAEKWEKFAGWVVAAFAAIAGLSVSNYDKVLQITSARTVNAVLWLFFAAVVLHALQKVCATFVQAGVAGGKVSKDMDLKLKMNEVQPFLDAVSGAYPWPASWWLGKLFAKMMRTGVGFVSGVMIRAALLSTLLAALQLVLGLIAIGAIGFALHNPTP